MSQQKTMLGAFALLLVLFGAGCLPTARRDSAQTEQPMNGSIASHTVTSTFGYSFLYPATYDIHTYKLSDAEIAQGSGDEFDGSLEGYTLWSASIGFPEASGEEFVGEGPPTIEVSYWTNDKNLPLVEWAKRNRANSGFYEGTPVYTEETLAGKKAIRFGSGGLYSFKNILVEHDGGVLHISAGYLDEQDTNIEVFDIILKRLAFTK